eukprot:664227-Hanusia_phi.AAC.1
MICDIENCKNKADYGIKQQKANRCKTHKEEGMVSKPIDYCEHNRKKRQCEYCTNKTCTVDGCDKKALYGQKGYDMIHCDIHKIDGDVKRSKDYCIHGVCKNKGVECKSCEKNPEEVKALMNQIRTIKLEMRSEERNEEKEKRGNYRCIDCNCVVNRNYIKRCSDCYHKSRRRQVRPSYEEILEDFKSLKAYTKVAEKYGVTDNTIRRWIKDYELHK